MATVDRCLASLFPRLIAAVGPSGAIFLTWDEGVFDSGYCKVAAGVIVTIAAGGAVRRHARAAVRYDHYSLLRTIEDAWRLPELGYAHCSCTLPISALLRSR